MNEKNQKVFKWLVSLLSISWLCCFSNDWFCNYCGLYFVIEHSYKQCPLCNETWCANSMLTEFICIFSVILNGIYIHAHSCMREQNGWGQNLSYCCAGKCFSAFNVWLSEIFFSYLTLKKLHTANFLNRFVC